MYDHAEYNKAYRKANRPKIRRVEQLHRLRNAGVPEDEIKRAKLALIKFDGKCQICQSTDSKTLGNFCLDHDHKTLKFRGIICGHCNSALGFVKDSLEVLRALITYIERVS